MYDGVGYTAVPGLPLGRRIGDARAAGSCRAPPDLITCRMLDALLEAIYAAWRKDTELRRDGLTGEAEGSLVLRDG